MSSLSALADAYVAVWNEADAERRHALIADCWNETAVYLDPIAQSRGRAGLHDLVAAIRQRFPGHRLRRAGEVDGHHGRVRFNWELVSPAGEVAVAGVDFCEVVNGRLQSVTSFFDIVTAPARATLGAAPR